MSNYMSKNELDYVINRSSPEPLYLQVGKILEEKIKSGEYDPGERLQAEEYFAAVFGVSRPTVNKAIEYLIGKRVVRRDKGRGTYIEDSNFRHIEFNDLIGIMNYKGHQIRTDVLYFGELRDSSKVPNWLRTAWDDHVLLLKRVRHIDNVPFFISEHFMPYSFYKCLSDIDFTTEFLSNALKIRCNKELVKMEREVRVVVADTEEVNRLGIMASDPVLMLTGTAFKKNNKPLFHHVTRFDAHKVILQGVGFAEHHVNGSNNKQKQNE